MDNDKLERFFSNSSTEEEIKEIQNWIEENPENNTAFSKAYKKYVMTALAVLRSGQTSSQYTSKSKTQRRRKLLSGIIAGTISAAAVLGIGIFIGDRMSMDTNQHILISADAGQRANVILADGTTVVLNSGSSLEYPASFTSKQRKVKLDGEALFDVTSDKRHPFVVETSQYDVKVLGTRFDIIAEKGSSIFSTSLLEGMVNIIDKTGKEIAVLHPDQKITIENGAVSIREVHDIEVECQWTDGIISVAGQPFDKIIEVISRSYGVKIRIEKESLPELRFSYLKLRISDGIEHALKSLQRGSDFTYIFDDSKEEYIIR